MNYFPIAYHIKPIGHAIDKLSGSTGVIDDLIYRYSYHSNPVQCFLTSESTLSLNWKSAYNKGLSTATIINWAKNHKLTKCSNTDINNIGQGYTSSVEDVCIKLINDKLVVFLPIFLDIQYIGYIKLLSRRT